MIRILSDFIIGDPLKIPVIPHAVVYSVIVSLYEMGYRSKQQHWNFYVQGTHRNRHSNLKISIFFWCYKSGAPLYWILLE